MLAVKHEKADLVELLLNNDAAVNLQDSDGSTALIYAVEQGSLNIIKLLLSKPECNVDISDNVINSNKKKQTSFLFHEEEYLFVFCF